MTPERWQELKKVLAGALDRAPEERRAYLDGACIDGDLRSEVESLIATQGQGDGRFLEQVSVSSAPLEKGSRLGEYRIVACIGAGGMGEVYRARDTRLNRDVAIKVLPSFLSADRDRLRRFEQEARAAAALNHPNILAVFQMGTHDSAPYMVSELLEGSTIREQVKRGALPLRKAIDYGVQVAQGLAAAHEKGIVHRDLKPENLFVTKDGRVKILDFGLAKLTQRAWTVDSKAPTISELTQPGAVVGTVGYMSPEQVRGKAADHRTDIFAFGAVLYEMLTGKRAFRNETAAETMSAILNEDPPAVSQTVPTAPAALQRVLQRCLEKNPEQRFQSASDLAFALEALSDSGSVSTETTVRRPAARRVQLWTAAALVVVALAGATAGYLYFHRAPKLTDRDSIVIADFANSTGDAVFDGALRQALSVELQQTPYLQLVSDRRVGQTLQLMEKPSDIKLTPAIAREVCQRANATTDIEGSIAALGSQYVLGLNAVACGTGETLAAEQVTADGKEKVIAALTSAASELRSKLGESSASLKRFDTPLDQVTTPSLEALQDWGLGTQAMKNGDLSSASSSFQRAVTLDPNFAVAYSALATVYSALGEETLSIEAAQKGYQLRDRVSDRERFSIESYYDIFVLGNLEKGIEVARTWVSLFPRDVSALGALAITYGWSGRSDEAQATNREILRIEPTTATYGSVAGGYIALGRLDEARATVREAESKHFDPSAYALWLYGIAFLRSDDEAMARQLSVLKNEGPYTAPVVEFYTAAYSGHLARARELARGAIASATQRREPGFIPSMEATLAVVEALEGDAVDARNDLRNVGDLSITRNFDVMGEAAMAEALSGEIARTQTLADDLNKRFPEATIVQFGYLPAVRGLNEAHQGNAREAAEDLSPMSSHERVIPLDWVGPYLVPVYLRGETHLALHRPVEASADFQLIIDNAGIVQNCPIGALAHLGLGRAYALEAQSAKGAEADAARAKAKAAYQDFLSLWKDADPDVPVLKQAKAEYAKLQ
jgi:eukaryotic-like serine/threonine-protein kinase